MDLQLDDIVLISLWKNSKIGSRQTNYVTVQVIEARDVSSLDWCGGSGTREKWTD